MMNDAHNKAYENIIEKHMKLLGDFDSSGLLCFGNFRNALYMCLRECLQLRLDLSKKTAREISDDLKQGCVDENQYFVPYDFKIELNQKTNK